MRTRTTPKTFLTVMSAMATLLALTACSTGSPAGASTDPTPVMSSPPSAGASAAPDFAAYRDCMAENGITLPDMGALPTAMPSAMPSGGPGTFPGQLPDGVEQETFDAAQAACAELAPTLDPRTAGGPGGSRAVDASALTAFRSCLSDNGVELTADQDPMRDLDRSDPQVKAALDTCAPLFPAPVPPASG